jgi:hypothetical protein
VVVSPIADCAPRFTVIEIVLLPVPAAFVAATVTVNVPAAAGTPVMAPVAASIVSGAGSPEAVNDVGLPLPATTYPVKFKPTSPMAVEPLVMFGTARAVPETVVLPDE